MDDLLEQGIAAYKAGNQEGARKIFIALVKQNPESERAWGWMYQTSGNDKERIYCLKQVLRISPNNEKASQLLDQLLAPSPPPPPTSQPPTQAVSPAIKTRKCPRCGEAIQARALRCKYCGWDLEEEKEARKKRTKKRITSVISAIGIIIAIIICGLIYESVYGIEKGIGPAATPTRTPEESAWYACTLFIEQQLKVSVIDAQRYNPDGVIRLDNGQYRVDVNYAKSSVTYTCLIVDHSGGRWELISLVATRK
jgi:tetratricopeptide (TPR) repeat protein